MGATGYINWDLIAQLPHWETTREGTTFVYAYWLVDYGVSPYDDGVRVFKRDSAHPDWFIHSDKADRILTSQCLPDLMVSDNYRNVFDERGGRFHAKPLLASILLGTSDAVYATHDRRDYWTCAYWNLDRRGKKMVRDLTILYQRGVQIVTFLDLRPMKEATPEVGQGSATVLAASGPHSVG